MFWIKIQFSLSKYSLLYVQTPWFISVGSICNLLIESCHIVSITSPAHVWSQMLLETVSTCFRESAHSTYNKHHWGNQFVRVDKKMLTNVNMTAGLLYVLCSYKIDSLCHPDFCNFFQETTNTKGWFTLISMGWPSPWYGDWPWPWSSWPSEY